MTKLERNDFLNKQKDEREYWDDVLKPTKFPQEMPIFFGSIEQLKSYRNAITSVGINEQRLEPPKHDTVD